MNSSQTCFVFNNMILIKRLAGTTMCDNVLVCTMTKTVENHSESELLPSPRRRSRSSVSAHITERMTRVHTC